jgi:DNA-binding CsgD family transcriptional regulator
MPDVTLTECQQNALSALLSAAHGSRPAMMRQDDILLAVAALIPCDVVGAGSRSRSERWEQRLFVGPFAGDVGSADPQPHSTAPARRDDATATARHELCVDVGQGDHSAQVWLDRTGAPFTSNEHAILAMISPVVQGLIGHRAPPESSTLTTQERRVLEGVAAGRSNAEIADELFVAPSTVRKHLEHAFRKLGVSSRFAALAVIEGRAPGTGHGPIGPDPMSTGNTPIRE